MQSDYAGPAPIADTAIQLVRNFKVHHPLSDTVELRLVVTRDRAEVYTMWGDLVARLDVPAAPASPEPAAQRPPHRPVTPSVNGAPGGSQPLMRMPVIEAALLPSGDLYFDQTPEAVRTTARAHRGLVLLLPVLEDYRQNHPMLHRVR